MTPALTQIQIDEHNSLYEKAWKLTNGELHLDGKKLPKPNWFSRRRLQKARKLFLQAIEINSMNWSAMLAIGKIEQRLEKQREALDWFLKAREFEPVNTSLAKEASLTASSLGEHSLAARIADEAIEINPTDPALLVNSGLAHLLSGECDCALRRFQEAVELEPSQPMNSKLVAYTVKVIGKQLPQPKNETDVLTGIKRA